MAINARSDTKSYDGVRTVLDTATDTAVTGTGDQSNMHPVSPFASRSLSVTVDFGDGVAEGESQMAVTRLDDVPWIFEAAPRPICRVVGRPGVDGLDDEDALLDGVTAIVTNIVDDVSCDVVAYAPEGTTGQFTVQLIGV